MIRVRICTSRCRCQSSCRRSRFSGLGTQIRGKRFSSSSFRISRASSRLVFCFRTRSLLISAASPIHTSKPNSASNRSNQREYPVASMPTRTQIRRFLAASGFDRISLLVHHCGSVPVHHTHQSLLLKMQSSESSGDNLCLYSSCSAPSSRAYGRQATTVYSGRGSQHCYEIICTKSPKCCRLSRRLRCAFPLRMRLHNPPLTSNAAASLRLPPAHPHPLNVPLPALVQTAPVPFPNTSPGSAAAPSAEISLA